MSVAMQQLQVRCESKAVALLQINDGLFAGVAADLYMIAGTTISGNSELAGKQLNRKTMSAFVS
jgi:hypothetical protein